MSTSNSQSVREDTRAHKKGNSYRGVRQRSWGKWVSEVREPKKRSRIWLGSYNTQEAAARAYDTALVYLRGPSARFNFPDSHLQAPVFDSYPAMSPKAIQKAALEEGARRDRSHATSVDEFDLTSVSMMSTDLRANIQCDEAFTMKGSPSQQPRANLFSDAYPTVSPMRVSQNHTLETLLQGHACQVDCDLKGLWSTSEAFDGTA